MKVYWNKDFYEKYKSVFDIQVWALKEIPKNNLSTAEYHCNYTTTSICNVLLDLSFDWKETNGGLTALEWMSGVYEYYPVRRVYMEIPDELEDIFPDLEPYTEYSYSVSWTVQNIL